MTSLAPIIIPTIAVIITSASLLVAYRFKIKADQAVACLDHWRDRAVAISIQVTEQQRLRSERTAKGNRTRAAKRRGE